MVTLDPGNILANFDSYMPIVFEPLMIGPIWVLQHYNKDRCGRLNRMDAYQSV